MRTMTASSFASAVAALQPFFDISHTWSSTGLDHFAYYFVRDHRPDLTAAEAYVLVVAARHLYAAQRQHRAEIGDAA